VTGAERLFGSWRLRKCQIEFVETRQRIDLYGARASGRLIFGRDQRMMVLLIDPERQAAGDTDALMAYSGQFRIEGEDRFVTDVDIAWNAEWLGGQPRFFSIRDDQLEISTPRQVHPAYPDREVWSHIRWEREEAIAA
jgi:hypothetical protein